HANPFNQARRKYGLPPLGSDVREIYCDGDLTLYADIPDIVPVYGAPAHHCYIGLILWSPPVGLPAWWDEATSGASTIYVSLGSSGPSELLPMVIDALLPLGHPVVVSTAGRKVTLPRAANVWVAEYIPGSAIVCNACVVICNGGSMTTQQALTCGVPVIGITSNLDQLLNMGYVDRFGAGALIRADRTSSAEVSQIARR